MNNSLLVVDDRLRTIAAIYQRIRGLQTPRQYGEEGVLRCMLMLSRMARREISSLDRLSISFLIERLEKDLESLSMDQSTRHASTVLLLWLTASAPTLPPDPPSSLWTHPKTIQYQLWP